MTYNNPGTHGMPDKVESGCPLYYAALGHSYAQNCLVAASFAISPRSRRNYLTGPAHEPRTPWEIPSSLLAEYLSEYAPWFSSPVSGREKRRRRGCDIVVKDRTPPPPLPPPPVTRGRMIYRRTVVAAYKTVIMFYHPGQSTETATAGSRNLGATTPRAYNE